MEDDEESDASHPSSEQAATDSSDDIEEQFEQLGRLGHPSAQTHFGRFEHSSPQAQILLESQGTIIVGRASAFIRAAASAASCRRRCDRHRSSGIRAQSGCPGPVRVGDSPQLASGRAAISRLESLEGSDLFSLSSSEAEDECESQACHARSCRRLCGALSPGTSDVYIDGPESARDMADLSRVPDTRELPSEVPAAPVGPRGGRAHAARRPLLKALQVPSRSASGRGAGRGVGHGPSPSQARRHQRLSAWEGK